MEINKAIQKLNNSRQSLLVAVQQFPQDQVTSRPVEGEWTLKDLLGHISAWEITLLELLKKLVTENVFDVQVVTDGQEFNAIQSRQRQELPFPLILDELKNTRQQMIDYASQLNDSQCQVIFEAPWGGQGTIPEMLAGLSFHEDEHTHSISLIIHSTQLQE